ncbi:hypothetical protein [Variovorax sp. 3P27G3]|uniref:hypothetical protein n=1 Tax=Variovorax sp. 3P27G3 TaxID=2502214 RepID=UPI0010FA063B|nr:hypothetical protein [Variovorax sp. 3P27G3]
MAAEKIGDGKCPLCAGAMRVSLSKNGLAVMTCNSCNSQLFARSGRSDELLRACITRPANAPEPAPAPSPSTVPAAPAVAPAAPIAEPPRRLGLFQW